MYTLNESFNDNIRIYSCFHGHNALSSTLDAVCRASFGPWCLSVVVLPCTLHASHVTRPNVCAFSDHFNIYFKAQKIK